MELRADFLVPKPLPGPPKYVKKLPVGPFYEALGIASHTFGVQVDVCGPLLEKILLADYKPKTFHMHLTSN